MLNSTEYWTGNPYPADNTLGAPCAVKFLDVKATEDKIPLLFKWLPASPSPKTKARIEIHKVLGLTGLLPVAVPEVFPDKVAALFVNENSGNIVGGANLNAASPPGLSAFNVYQGDVGGGPRRLGQLRHRHRVVARSVVRRSDERDARVGLQRQPGADDLLRQAVELAGNRVYTIWAYRAPRPAAMQPAGAQGGGADAAAAARPTSPKPYFNLDAGCSIAVSAHIESNTGGDPTPSPLCAQAWVNGNPMTCSSGSAGGPEASRRGRARAATTSPSRGRPTRAAATAAVRSGAARSGPPTPPTRRTRTRGRSST